MTTLAAAAAAPLYVPADAPQNKGISKEEANARIRSLKEARSDFEDRWKEIRDYQLPFLGCFSDAGDDTSPARRRDTKIIDSTCWLSVETFGAGIMSGLTPPSRQWFKLGFSRSDTEEDVEAMRILDERQKIWSISFTVPTSTTASMPAIWSFPSGKRLSAFSHRTKRASVSRITR